MKGFPLLIYIYKQATEQVPNGHGEDRVYEYLTYDEEGTYIVKSPEDFPSSDYMFKVVEYNYNSEKYGVFQR
jgi:hypothetical protein